MDYLLDEELEMLRQSAAEYAERELAPHAARLDAEERFPDEAIRAAAEAGFLGLVVPEEYGGAGLGNLHAAIMLEEINAVDASVGVTISVHMSLVSSVVARYGNDDQKQRWLPDLASGARIGAYCLTEPEVGSDAASIRTRAEKVDGGWKISGTKAWITTAAESGLMIVYAVTDADAPRGQGISAFLVDPATDGVVVGKKEPKLGLRASSTSEVVYDNVFVPDADVLGELNTGFKIALSALDGGRIGIAAQALGIARAALEKAISYAKERQAFGRAIADFQAIQWMIADSDTEL